MPTTAYEPEYVYDPFSQFTISDDQIGFPTHVEPRWIAAFGDDWDEESIPKVVVFPSDVTACGHLRAYWPAREVHRAGRAAVFVSNVVASDAIDMADICVFQRVIRSSSLDAMRYARAQGKAVVLDTDDNFARVQVSRRKALVAEHGGDLTEIFESAARLAHVLTVSTPELQKEYGRVNRNIFVRLNRVYSWGAPRGLRRTSRPIVGFAGSGASPEDFVPVGKAMTRVMARHPEVRFVLTGDKYLPALPPDVREKVELRGYAPFHSFHSVLSDFDVGLAPMSDTGFNRSKSEVKCLDYGSAGIPCVCGRVAPYIRYQKEGRKAMGGQVCALATTADEWEAGIESYLVPSIREEVGVRSGVYTRIFHSLDASGGMWWEPWERALNMAMEATP